MALNEKFDADCRPGRWNINLSIDCDYAETVLSKQTLEQPEEVRVTYKVKNFEIDDGDNLPDDLYNLLYKYISGVVGEEVVE